MWINVSDEEADALIALDTPLSIEIGQRARRMREDMGDCAATIETARGMYALRSNDDLEIDDEPSVSIADEGTWVMAWVWVPDADEGDADEGDADEKEDEDEGPE